MQPMRNFSVSKKIDLTQSQFCLKRCCAALLLVFTVQAVQANPLGPSVASGQASFNTSGNTLTVTNTPNTIINWQGFSIGANEATRFVQQSAASAVLNRVTGGNPSNILGSLQSNGRVFLVNPNGIMFGADATVDVAGLVATSLNLSNADFLAGRYHFSQVPGAQSISNAGNIAAQNGGQIYLIAPDVENTGVINAPNGEILLAAGHSVELVNSLEPNLRVNITAPAGDATNVGQLIAESGSLGLFGTVVRNSGMVSADSATRQGGKVVFKAASRTEISGAASANGVTGGTIQALGNQVGIMDGATISADGAQGGGTILVGGDYQGKNSEVQNAQVTYVAPTATLSADATNNGDGGKIIVWADDTARVYGNISVRGGINGGNGGFVETSGHRYLDVSRAPDLTALSGKGGAWLLDPEDITISSAADSNITGAPTFTPAAAGSSLLSDAVLRAALVAGGTVTVDTTGGAGITGSILVDATASLTSIDLTSGAATLYLKAHNDITVNSSITAINNPLTIYLIADQDSNSTGAVYINKALNSNNGNINISSGEDIVLNVGTGTNIAGGSGTVNLTSTGGAIIGDMMGGPLDISAANVILNAVTGISASGAQFYVDAASISFSNTGSQYVRIYNNHSGASSFTGSTGGALGLESYDSANPTSVGNVTAGGDIVMRINNINVNGPVDAGANTVYLAPFTAGLPVSIQGGAIFDLSGAEISNISAGKIVVGHDTYGNYASAAQIGTGAAVSITNAANLEVWGDTLSTGNTVSNAGGQITLVSDDMTLVGSINSGLVWLKGKSYSQNIDLGGADAGGTLGLTSAELDTITASVLRIGLLAGSGGIHVSSAIAPSNAATLSLMTGGDITQAGAISATNLAIMAGGNVGLNAASNAVTNLAVQLSGAGSSFSFENATALNVGSNIDGVSGVTSSAGSVNITAVGLVGSISTAGVASIAAPGGSVNLTAQGDNGISLSGTGSVSGNFVSFFADKINLGTTGLSIEATGSAMLAPFSPGLITTLGSNDVAGISMGLTNAEMNKIKAGTFITIGSWGDILVDGIVDITSVGGTSQSLDLHGFTVIQSASGGVKANKLELDSNSTVDFDNAPGNNAVNAISGFSTGQPYNFSQNGSFSVQQAGACCNGITGADITLTSVSGSISIPGFVVGSGVVSLNAAGGITLNASANDAYILAPNVNLTLGGNFAFASSGGYNAYVSSTLPATTNLTFTNVTGKVLFNGVQATATTSGNMGFFSGGAPGTGTSAVVGVDLIVAGGDAANFTVPPTLSECIANPALAGCTSVLPSLSTCTAAPATAGCEVVLPSLATCIASPATAGCEAVLPPPPPTADQCTVDPTLAGCTAALSTAVQNTVANVTTTLAVSTTAMPVIPLATPTLTQASIAPAPATDAAPTDFSGTSSSDSEEKDKDAVIATNAPVSTDAPATAALMPVCK